ncbi:MAG TPA: carboxypeptidase-like regulatory domain-containing protein [Bryobacteraceae bacterium]|nr:carboxypeptidase-like regulatory domain-containing protein [Bryobacteraceae bacterium]
MTRETRWASLILAIAITADPSAAQTTFAGIVGTVRDASGAVVPGLKVTANNTATGEQSSQPTNELGIYQFTTLKPGNYILHAEHGGFRPLDVQGISLQINQTARVDITMEIGQTTEAIEVQSSAPVLATSTTDIGQVISNQKISTLP